MSESDINDSYIIAAEREVDGAGSLAPLHARWNELRNQGARLTELTIDPLAVGWDSPLTENHFRSGCAPIEALAHADRLIRDNRADAVLIQGADYLRPRSPDDRLLRQQQMAIYGADCSIPEAYTSLAHAFIRRHHLTPALFKQLAEDLFENYIHTAQSNGSYQPPKPHAYEMETDLFRKLDCANPNIDFAGAVIVASAALANSHGVKILATELAQTEGDGPAHVEQLARYDHLRQACEAAATRSGLDLHHEFNRLDTLLEAYTCFPVAPLGFLLASGIARTVDEIIPLLQSRPITVTGGMNLARAPWNNPALNALIVMSQRLPAGDAQLGLVHGNGGLGYRQGIALLHC